MTWNVSLMNRPMWKVGFDLVKKYLKSRGVISGNVHDCFSKQEVRSDVSQIMLWRI